MQVLDDKKREAIREAAARLFAERPFHEVRLEDVARAAQIGKGTLYLYFENKEALYTAVVEGAFSELVDGLRKDLLGGPLSPIEKLRRVVEGLVRFASGHPHLFHLTRAHDSRVDLGPIQAKRVELSELITELITEGVEEGVYEDRYPTMTAQYLLGCVRGAFLFGPPEAPAPALVDHIVRLFEGGLTRHAS